MGLFLFLAPEQGPDRQDGENNKWAGRPTFCLDSANTESVLSRETLLTLLEPAVNAMGYDLVDLVHNPGPQGGLVRIYIDHEPSVTVEDCERVSKQVSALLDVEDPIAGDYVLEVSSPGEKRHLRTPAHFERFVGSPVKVQLKLAQDGRRRFTGTLLEVAGDEIAMDVDGSTVNLSLDAIERARLAPQK